MLFFPLGKKNPDTLEAQKIRFSFSIKLFFDSFGVSVLQRFFEFPLLLQKGLQNSSVSLQSKEIKR
jgi:hypothetical protein